LALRVSVILPHYQDLDGLERCLAALERQTFPSSQAEIIVADNGSPVGEATVARRIAGRARLVTEPMKGAGPARNAGAKLATGDILAFIDSDCIADPGWLEAGVAAIEKAHVVGGRVCVLVDNPREPTPTEAFECVFAFDFEDYILRKGFTGSGNMFVWARIFREVGGFRSGVSEDTEWCHRAISKGFGITYAPLAIVGHPARRSWAELRTKWQRILSERFKLHGGDGAGRLRWLLLTWATPLSAVIHSIKVLRNPNLPNMRARAGAIAILFRIRLWRFIEGHRLLLRRAR
jgi:GT2 family glycosyltransferase